MPNHIIEKIEPRVFKIQWEDMPDSLIILDFRPLIAAYNLANRPGVMEHWQAKPIGLRRWGLYSVLTDDYYSVNAQDIMFLNGTKSASLQIPEKDYPNIRPTAVKYYEPAFITRNGDNRYIVGNI